MYSGNDNFMNAVDMAALIIGIMNMLENEQQTAYNDVHAANDKQAKFLLQELDNRFNEQNAILEEQTLLLKDISADIRLLIAAAYKKGDLPLEAN